LPLGLTAALQQMNSLSSLILSAKKLADKWFQNLTKTLLILADNWHALLQDWEHFPSLITLIFLLFFTQDQEFKHTHLCNQVMTQQVARLSLILNFVLIRFKITQIASTTLTTLMLQQRYGTVLGV
jgi:hypothetical protein